MNTDASRVAVEVIEYSAHFCEYLVRERHGGMTAMSRDPRLRIRHEAAEVDVAVLAREAETEERTVQAALTRDIFGNPFRPVALDPCWRSETVVALASAIYAERAFDRMPILADALEDAGSDHADMLAHCRGGGPHVRGCWVVDLILGKQ